MRQFECWVQKKSVGKLPRWWREDRLVSEAPGWVTGYEVH